VSHDPVTTNDSFKARACSHRAPGVPALRQPLTRRTLLATAGLGVLGLLTGAACVNERSVATPRVTPVTDRWPANDLLVSAGWLRDRLDDPRLRLVDCSSIDAYRAGHLPRAVHVWWQDTLEVNNPVYGMLTGAPVRERIIRETGIAPDTTVVCYDASGGVYAARVIWMLHGMGYFGARLLDGGSGAWVAAGGELVDDAPSVPEGGISALPNEEILAHGHDIVTWIGRPGLVIIDTRTASEREETWFDRLRTGMIPESRWLPRDAWLTDDAAPSLLAPDELRGRLSVAGVPPDSEEAIVYGLHGTLAALPYLALLALGIPRVRVYDGSWSEWGARAEWPVAPLG
jgi:thiosulfate/3-mercaptopyruvate sulfurtransferase